MQSLPSFRSLHVWCAAQILEVVSEKHMRYAKNYEVHGYMSKLRILIC